MGRQSIFGVWLDIWGRVKSSPIPHVLRTTQTGAAGRSRIWWAANDWSDHHWDEWLGCFQYDFPSGTTWILRGRRLVIDISLNCSVTTFSTRSIQLENLGWIWLTWSSASTRSATHIHCSLKDALTPNFNNLQRIYVTWYQFQSRKFLHVKEIAFRLTQKNLTMTLGKAKLCNSIHYVCIDLGFPNAITKSGANFKPLYLIMRNFHF